MPERAQLPERRVLVRRSLQSIRWGDIDMLGQVSNTVYFRCMASIGSFCELRVARTQYADGAARMPWIDHASGRPVPLPDCVVAPLRARGA
ncbi:MAG TPA: hypothetical protein VF059_01820 [Casimicrobiaceae bacterium]